MVMGMASSIASAVQSRKAANETRKKENIIEQQAKENESIFNKQYYQDVTKRTDIQNMLRLLDEKQRRADSRSDALSAIVGATPEQQLASKEVSRRSYADALATMASEASALKDNYLRDYTGQRNRYYAQRLGMQDQLAGIHQNESNQWAQAGVNAFNAGAQMLGQGLDGMAGTTPIQTPPPADGGGQTGGITPAEQQAINAKLSAINTEVKRQHGLI